MSPGASQTVRQEHIWAGPVTRAERALHISLQLQVLEQKPSGMRRLAPGDLFRGARDHDPAALVSALGAEVDEVVLSLIHI